MQFVRKLWVNTLRFYTVSFLSHITHTENNCKLLPVITSTRLWNVHFPSLGCTERSIRPMHLRGGMADGITVRAHFRRRPRPLSAVWKNVRKCLYSTLGLSCTASIEDIRNACAAVIAVDGGDSSSSRTDARQACALLLDRQQRTFYDKHRSRILAAGRRHAAVAKERAYGQDASATGSSLGVPRRSDDGDRATATSAAEQSAFDVLMRRPAGATAVEAPLTQPASTGAGSGNSPSESNRSAFDLMMRRFSQRGSSAAASHRMAV